MDMLHLPLLHDIDSDLQDQLNNMTPPEYYWLVLEATKEILINKLHLAGKLGSASVLVSKSRQRCLERANAIVRYHFGRCES